MALVLKDRVKETTTTTGTGSYALGNSVSGFQNFSVIGNNNTTFYCCTDRTDFEIGIGTYSSSGNTLARTTILASSDGGDAINWSAGDKDIFVTQPSNKAVYLDASGHIETSDGRNLTNVNATTLDSIDSTSFLRSDAADTKTSGNLTLSDGVHLNIGSGNDIRIQHSASTSLIDSQTVDLKIRQMANDRDIILQSDNGSGGLADYIRLDGSTGQVILYRYGEAKLQTLGSGVTVTGTLTATTFSGNGSSLTNVNASSLNSQSASYYLNASNISSGTLSSDRLPSLTVSNFASASITTSSEDFADNDTTLMTSAAINDRIQSFGYTTNVGDITGVTAGSGLSGGGDSGSVTLSHADTSTLSGTYGNESNSIKIDTITVDANGHVTAIETGPTGSITAVEAGTGIAGGGSSGEVSLNLDFGELTDMTADISGSTEFILLNGDSESRKAASEIKLSAFNNDSGFITSADGGNATTLDNLDSTSFIRSDAADSFSGVLTGTAPIELNGGVTYDPSSTGDGTDTATDVALSLGSGKRIVGHASGFIRTLLEWNSSSTLEIGQNNTALINHTKIYGGSGGGVELYEGSSKKLETIDSGVKATGDIEITGNLVFEGSTANTNETTLTVVDPTADRTVTIQNASGTLALTSDIPTNISELTNDSGYTTNTGDITGVTAGTGLSGGGDSGGVTLNLANTSVTAGSYTNTNLTVDAQGRITAASNGSGGGVSSDSDGNTVGGTGVGTGGTSNTIFGKDSGTNLTTGSHSNVYLGRDAGVENTTGVGNVAIGRRALEDNTGQYNVAIGHNAGTGNTSFTANGGFNTMLGYFAGYYLQTGANNVLLGQNAGQNTTTNSNNVYIGAEARRYQGASSTANVAVGHNSMRGSGSGQGIQNSSLGYRSAFALTDARYTTSIGYESLYSVTTQYGNTAVGHNAGYATTGTYNTYIGRASGSTVTTGSKNTILGNFTGNNTELDIRTSSNNVVLSDGDGNVRMSFNSSGVPSMGGLSYPTTDGTNGQVLTTNGSGTLSFTTVSGGGSGLSNVVEDTTPELGGDLSLGSNALTYNGSDVIKGVSHSGKNSVRFYSDGTEQGRTTGNGLQSMSGFEVREQAGNGEGDLYLGVTSSALTYERGIFNLKNTGTQSEIRMYCEQANAHYASIKAPAHSAFSGNVTLTLPASTGTLLSTASNLSDLANVASTAPTTNQVLKWNGSAWSPADDSTGSGGSGGNADTVDNYHLSVVTSMPSSPDSNTIYFVTG